MTAEIQSGGCQCGAIRFKAEGALGDASVCHCRMCQKAFGNFYAPLVSVGTAKLTWTRGTPKKFHSSNFVERAFCSDCGTPLTYEGPDGIALAIGAFDHPESIVPVVQFGVEGMVAYVNNIPSLPVRHTLEDIAAAPFLKDIVSYQHPDHDTPDGWRPK